MTACNLHVFAKPVRFTLRQRISLAWRAFRCRTMAHYFSRLPPRSIRQLAEVIVVRLVPDDKDDLRLLGEWSEAYAEKYGLKFLHIASPEFVDDSELVACTATERRLLDALAERVVEVKEEKQDRYVGWTIFWYEGIPPDGFHGKDKAVKLNGALKAWQDELRERSEG